ncbi:hypothetical protein F5Y17DRAFT_413631 [Xylariaceae sp. FL0594]|nr:hypothetical protein F5Y17DRAFT_413631 [Xylariaceae sp. FL0594]
MRFIPQERGREETLAWLDTGTCESLKALLTHRDQAARQIRIRRGPRTLGNREVQAILREPSRRSVQRLHDVILGVEMDLVYGSLVGGSVTAVFHYNFSRAVGWNKNRQQAAASSRKVPSLQLREMVPAGMAAAAAARRTTTPSVGGRSPMPIRWLQLPTDSEQGATPDIRIARSWTPLSELGGWREEDEEEGGGGGNDIADYKRLSDRTILGSVTDSHNSHTHNNNYENSCGEEPLSSIDGWREEGEHKHSQVVCNTFSSTTSSPARLATKAEAMAVTIIRAQVRQVDVSNSIAKPTE